MSSKSVRKEKNNHIIIDIEDERNFEQIISEAILPFSEVIRKIKSPDIYTGKEKIPFNERHPNFKSLMRIEFEDAIRAISKKTASC